MNHGRSKTQSGCERDQRPSGGQCQGKEQANEDAAKCKAEAEIDAKCMADAEEAKLKATEEAAKRKAAGGEAKRNAVKKEVMQSTQKIRTIQWLK